MNSRPLPYQDSTHTQNAEKSTETGNPEGASVHGVFTDNSAVSVRLNAAREKEKPGALAGASGFDFKAWLAWIDDNLKRGASARSLIAALLDCSPADRLPFLEIIFEAIRPGMPIVAFDSVMAEAYFWAGMASRSERKAYAFACYQRMSEADQRSFVAHITRAQP